MKEHAEPLKKAVTGGIVKKTVTVIAVIGAIYHLLFVVGFFQRIDIYMMAETHRAIHIAFILTLIYLLYPARRKASGSKFQWYNIILLLMAIIWPLYFAFNTGIDTKRWLAGNISTFEIVIAIVTIVLLLEAARRVVGLAIPILATTFFIYAMYGNYFPGFLEHRGYGLMRVINTLAYSVVGLPGNITDVSARILITFVIFGYFLLVSGAGEFFTDLANALIGKYRGGPAKAAVVGSMMMGMISGSGSANAVTTGSITIPLMKKLGYRPHFAAAVETVASNGGSLTPPIMGSVAFLMAEWLGISYWTICLASVIPAILYYICLYMYVDIEALRLNLRGLSPDEVPSLGKTLTTGFLYFIPLVVLIYLIAVLMYPVEVSAIYCIILTVIISWFRKKSRMGLKKILEALKGGAISMISPAIACITAEIIVGTIMLTGLGPKLTSTILSISGGNMFFILGFTAITCFILGMGMGAIPIYLILASLVAPALVQLGVPPLAAHMFVFWWGLTSHITPPVAVVAFAASAIAESSPMKTGFTASRLGVLTYVLPFIWVFQPSLLLLGPLTDTARVVLITLIAIMMFCFAIAGAMLNWWQRVLLLAGTVLALTFNWTFVGIGAFIGIAVFILYRFTGQIKRIPAEQKINK